MKLPTLTWANRKKDVMLELIVFQYFSYIPEHLNSHPVFMISYCSIFFCCCSILWTIVCLSVLSKQVENIIKVPKIEEQKTHEITNINLG
jgi:hypothetical protein